MANCHTNAWQHVLVGFKQELIPVQNKDTMKTLQNCQEACGLYAALVEPREIRPDFLFCRPGIKKKGTILCDVFDTRKERKK